MTDFTDEIIRFNIDRDLHKQEFNVEVQTINIIEEVLELNGLNIPADKRIELKDYFGNFYYNILNNVIEIDDTNNSTNKEDMVDALCDIAVLALGAIYNLGYSPKLAMLETTKEINSRVGTIIDGKFIKDTSNKAKANWYKANYHYCERDTEC